MLPYPVPTVDMGQYLTRATNRPTSSATGSTMSELAREAAADPSRPATVAAIGLHPFIVGTPAGAASFGVRGAERHHLVCD